MRDAATASTRIEMPASACSECPFRKQCPIEKTRDGKFTLEFSDKERRLAGRRVEEGTAVFKERYAPRSGIESTNSGLKNRLGLGRLPVRGRGSVFRVILHKVAGWNVLRAAASEKLRAWVQTQVARTLKGSESGPIGGPFAPILGFWEASRRILGFSRRFPPFYGLPRRLSENQRPITDEVLSETSISGQGRKGDARGHPHFLGTGEWVAPSNPQSATSELVRRSCGRSLPSTQTG